MFDYIKTDDDGIDLNTTTICFFIGWAPFVIAYMEYNTVFTEWLLQTYFLTIFLFVIYPRQFERRNLRQLWFWKAMLLVALSVHPAILAAMWLFDRWEKTKWREARTVEFIILGVAMIEFPLVQKIVDFFRPANDTPLKDETLTDEPEDGF